MALCPPISENGIPLRLQNEYFILERNGIEININIIGFNSLKAKCKLYLSSARIYFVNEDFKKIKHLHLLTYLL